VSVSCRDVLSPAAGGARPPRTGGGCRSTWTCVYRRLKIHLPTSNHMPHIPSRNATHATHLPAARPFPRRSRSQRVRDTDPKRPIIAPIPSRCTAAQIPL
jgi:hypothetical protein